MYTNNITYGRVKGGKSEWFRIDSGVMKSKHGDGEDGSEISGGENGDCLASYMYIDGELIVFYLQDMEER